MDTVRPKLSVLFFRIIALLLSIGTGALAFFMLWEQPKEVAVSIAAGVIAYAVWKFFRLIFDCD